MRPWADVVDRIGVTLAASRDAATRPGELAKARRLAEDAYWVEFEASDMETAVRKYLGYGPAGELERQFQAIRIGGPRRGREAPAPVGTGGFVPQAASRTWWRSRRELNAKGVTDRSRIDALVGHRAATGARPCRVSRRPIGPPAIPGRCSRRSKLGLRRVEQEAERNGPDEAASELTTVYMTEFEPLERYLLGRSPQAVRPLEIQFNTLRGDLTAGLKGEELAARLEAFSSEVETLIGRLEARPPARSGRRSSRRSSRSCARGSRSSWS